MPINDEEAPDGGDKQPGAAAPTSLVHPYSLGGPPGDPPAHRRAPRAVAGQARALGTMRLATVGRRTGKKREAILGYYEDGPNLVTMAMNGWGAPEPAWWLNLQAQPDASVELKNGERAVRARAAVGEERERLWARFREFGDDPDDYAHRRPGQTQVVVLEPFTSAES